MAIHGTCPNCGRGLYSGEELEWFGAETTVRRDGQPMRENPAEASA